MRCVLANLVACIAGAAANSCGGASIPNVLSVRVVGTAVVEAIGTVDLQTAGGPVIGRVGGVHLTENSIVVADGEISRGIFEYDLSGHFRRRIGVQGPGEREYITPSPRALCVTEDRFYVYDSANGKTKTYDRLGSFTRDLGRTLGYTGRLGADSGGWLYQTTMKDGVALMRKWSPSLKKEWEVALTLRDLGVLVTHFPVYAGFCLSERRGRAYFLPAGDFTIREIDSKSGLVVRVFGLLPEGFRSLPTRYHGLAEVDPGEARQIVKETTLLYGGMLLVSDRWLVTGFFTEGIDWEWIVYDMETAGDVYRLQGPGLDGRFHSTMGGRLVRYVEPADEELDASNGSLEMYRLRVVHGDSGADVWAPTLGAVASTTME